LTAPQGVTLYIDKADGRFIDSPLFKSPVETVSFKRGDAASVRVSFVNGFVVEPLADGAEIVFGIKESGKYDGEFLVSADTYEEDGDSYTLAPSFNTAALDDALNSGDDAGLNDVASLSAMLEISWSEDGGTTWQSSRTITANIANDVVKGVEGTPVALPDAEDWLATHGIPYSTAITGLTGGTSNRLDSIPTVDLPLKTMRAVFVSSVYFSVYILLSSDAPDNVPFTVRPDDYAAGTNEKVWYLQTARFDDIYAAGSVVANELRVQNAGGAQALFHNPNLIANIGIEIPDLVGDRKLCAVVQYANDSAAASAGLAIGDIYFTGTKFRARTV